MNKFLLSGSLIILFVLYGLRQRQEEVALPVVRPNLVVMPEGTASPTPSASAPPTPQTAVPIPTATGQYKDGHYTGVVADAIYGNLQVAVQISGGAITAVQFLQYPNDRSTSRAINSQAMPYLQQEVIQSQSTQVNGVSGATDTSQAFIESLGSALNKAH